MLLHIMGLQSSAKALMSPFKPITGAHTAGPFFQTYRKYGSGQCSGKSLLKDKG